MNAFVRRLLVAALISSAFFSLTADVSVDAAQDIRASVNGKQLPAGAVQAQGGITYVAVRPLSQLLGADIAVNGKAKTVTVTTLLRQIVLQLDANVALVNGQRVMLSAPPRELGGRVMLPMRAVAEAFGGTIVYDAKTHTADLKVALHATPSGARTPPPASAAKTLSGTVMAVTPNDNPPSLRLRSNSTDYNVTVPTGTSIAFRDIHGAVSGNSTLAHVRPGDALIVTLDGNGQLISMADIFASTNGVVAAVAESSMVLQSGRVVAANPQLVTITLDGKDATFGLLAPGDRVSVRADPVSGAVRDVVAFRPGGYAASALSTPAPGTSGGGAAQVKHAWIHPTTAVRNGQVLNVAADGSPSAHASFDLSNIITDNAMRETRPGHYEGQFAVTIGTNLTDAPVFVHLMKNRETAVAEAADTATIVTTPPSVRDASPRNGARINTTRPNIFATFATVGSSGMDPNSLQLWVNGREVSTQATRTASFISYYPPRDLNSKTVGVEVKGTDIAGNGLDYRWAFFINPK